MKKITILKRRRLSTKEKIVLAASGIVLLAIAVILLFSMAEIKEGEQETDEQETTGTTPDDAPEDQAENILLDKETNRESEYSLKVLRYDEIESELLLKWMDNSIASDTIAGETYDGGTTDGGTTDGESPVYYALYNNSSANLDIYLFMPAAKQIMGDVVHSSVRVTEANTALIIYIDTDEEATHTRESTDLILHIQAVSDKAKTKTEKLIINGVTYFCANTTFTSLDQ